MLKQRWPEKSSEIILNGKHFLAYFNKATTLNKHLQQNTTRYYTRTMYMYIRIKLYSNK